MTESQIEVVFQQLLGLGCRPPKALSTPQGFAFAVQCWTRALRDICPERMATAVLRYSRSKESVWWPTPGVLVDLIEQTDVNPEDNADEMWGRLLSLCGSRGRDCPPDEENKLHDDPAISTKMMAGLSACGGWQMLCRSTHSENMSNRAAFRSAYQAKGAMLKTLRDVTAASRLLLLSDQIAIDDRTNTKEP